MGIFKKSLVELIAVIVVLGLVFLVLNFFVGDSEEIISVVNVEINGKQLVLEIADNSLSREVGLAGRESLEENQGMIFAYEYEMKDLGFWMKDTLIPLDILFLNEELEVVYIIENMEVCTEDPCPKYISQEKAKYAIEVNAGWVEENSVKVGDKVEFIDPDQSGS